MGVRRTHTKSRKGCVQCKQKHIKCDETRPTCSNCTKFERQCSFQLEPSGPPSATTAVESSNISPTSPSPSSSSSSRNTKLNDNTPVLPPSEELGIMHHWTASTCKSLARTDNSNLHLWQVSVPQIGLKYRYLLDGIFAATCVHICTEEVDIPRRRRYVTAALAYQTRAVAALRDALKNPGPENCHAIYGCAIATLLTKFALPNAYWGFNETERPDPRTNIVETAIFTTGVATLQTVCAEYLADGPLSGLTSRPPDSEVPGPDPRHGEYENALSSLRTFITESAEIAAEDKDLYLEKLESLRKCFYQYDVYETTGPVMYWTTAAAQMMPQFKEGQTMALLIVMHWGVLIHRLRHMWWAKNYGTRLVASLTESLRGRVVKREWVRSIEWVNRGVDRHVGGFRVRTVAGTSEDGKCGIFELA